MKKIFKVYLTLVKMNYMKAMEYRLDLLSTLLPTMTYSLGYLVFLKVILSKIPTIAGWDLDKMLLIFGLEQLSFYIAWIFYKKSLEVFYLSIRDGTFDFTIRLPINSKFITSFREHSFDVIPPTFFAIALIVYSLRNTDLSIPGIALGTFLFICGSIILYNLTFAIASIAFLTVEAKDLTDLFNELTSFARYPLAVYPGPMIFVLLFIIPALLFAYVPATVILSMIDWKLVIISISMVFLTHIISNYAWQAGLRRYSSASS